MTGTRTDVRTDLSRGDTADQMAHYARKDEITRAAIEGGLVTALCGHKFPVTRDPTGLPVCGACKELLGMLRSMGG